MRFTAETNWFGKNTEAMLILTKGIVVVVVVVVKVVVV